MRKKMKRWMIGMAACVLLLSGCGASQSDKKASRPQPSAKVTKQPAEAAQKETEVSEAIFPSYQELMKKYKNRLFKASDWRSADGSYHYPVTDKDGEWEKMNQQEQWVACQMPEEIMEELDTVKLLELVLEFPMLDEIMFSDSYSEWITGFYATYFNGMNELINRPDFYETVLAYYEKLKIPLHKKSHLERFLPKNPTTEDYLAIPESESEKSSKDLRFANTVNFCMTVVGGLTDGVDKDVLKRAKKVFAKKLSEVEASEHKKNILTRDDVQRVDWMDQKVVGGLKDSDQGKDGKKKSKKSKAASEKKQGKEGLRE